LQGEGRGRVMTRTAMWDCNIEEGRAEKVLIKNLANFFLFPSKQFLPFSFKIQLLETNSPKHRRNKDKSSWGVISWLPDKFKSLKILCLFFLMSFLFFPLHFAFFAIFSYCNSRNVHLGPGKLVAKSWFGLEK
jgi:hypothetical protein